MPKKKKRPRRTRAQRADKYQLYEKSVQEPEADVLLIQRIFKNHYARPPRLLREDFWEPPCSPATGRSAARRTGPGASTSTRSPSSGGASTT
jgi:hypothetical protein